MDLSRLSERVRSDITWFLLVANAFLISGAANASTIFAPTDDDVNFLNSTIDLSGVDTQVAMFNVGDLGGANNAVVLSNSISSSAALFSPSSGNFNIDVRPTPTSSTTLDTMTLFGSNNFILGLTNNGATWIPDTGYTDLGGGFINVAFGEDNVLLQVDTQVVPVPAAVWLFGSGLLALVGMTRRKKLA